MAMMLPFRPSAQTSPSATRTKRSSGLRSSAPRYLKNIDVFDYTALQDTLPPNTGPPGTTQVISGSQANTSKNLSHVPCKFFKQGVCQAGKSCPFSHDLEGVLSAEKLPCKYFQKGNCKFGLKCALAHILPDGTRVNAKLSPRRNNDYSRSFVEPSPNTSNHRYLLADGTRYSPGQNTSKRYPELNDSVGQAGPENQTFFSGSSPKYISPSTNAFLIDLSHFKLGLKSGSEQDQRYASTPGEWLYSTTLGSDTNDTSVVSPVLFMSESSPSTNERLFFSFAGQSSHKLPVSRTPSFHHYMSSSSSPLMHYNKIVLEASAIVDDEEEDASSDDTYYEDYIPASLANLIFTPQEKKRRESRSQSGTLLVRPVIDQESRIQRKVSNSSLSGNCEANQEGVFLMD
ncbi:Zinc finger C-x8-C-x5-C-x3-H type and similar [Metschnikowia aff. pulcherrima]|uniref:Zinc finger C-x8-C-x5-C-x3-H type and similar n=1 Tax=Metschnikowia aff. pulcherrima TaxID=2163413 RepID=A0A4P6XGU2_9ASCO|nr:Zinc finger C-x8-C-x5-C-x3-H type and similar [Metschnikowia aff. pulcherrima]